MCFSEVQTNPVFIPQIFYFSIYKKGTNTLKPTPTLISIQELTWKVCDCTPTLPQIVTY